MSTASGHGLADPKRWGKPVSLANKGRRVRRSDGGDWGLFLVLSMKKSNFLSVGKRTYPDLPGEFCRINNKKISRKFFRTRAYRRIERESG